MCLVQGRRRGPAPLSRSPGLVAPFKRPDGKRAPVAHGHREAGALARARSAREEAAPDPFGRIEAICDRAGTHSALGRLGPPSSKGPIGPGKTDARRRRKGRRRNRGRSGFGGGGFANSGIGGLPEAPDVRRPLSRGGGPCDDAAIEPASRTPKKGLAYRRASAGLGRLRREPDPCARRRGGAMAHPALGCMGPAGFGNAGLSP